MNQLATDDDYTITKLITKKYVKTVLTLLRLFDVI